MKPVGEMKTYPKWLWTLQEAIADKLPDGQIEVWLARLANAVVTSTDLEDCKHRFFSRLLRECLVFDREQYPECATAIHKIADLHDRWKDIDEPTWSSSRHAARSAAWSAAPDESTRAAEWAACSAAYSTEPDWPAARSTARSAARSAAWSAAESAAWTLIAAILIEELER